MFRKSVIIDVQGFKNIQNKFILKELSICYETGEYQNFIIKPPHTYDILTQYEKKQINWLRKNHHGLSWYDGSITFKSVKNFLLDNISSKTLIYTKGLEKTEFIKKLINNKSCVINVEDIGCNKSFQFLKQIYPKMIKCGVLHYANKTCALENALIINYFITVSHKNKK